MNPKEEKLARIIKNSQGNYWRGPIPDSDTDLYMARYILDRLYPCSPHCAAYLREQEVSSALKGLYNYLIEHDEEGLIEHAEQMRVAKKALLA